MNKHPIVYKVKARCNLLFKLSGYVYNDSISQAVLVSSEKSVHS